MEKKKSAGIKSVKRLAPISPSPPEAGPVKKADPPAALEECAKTKCQVTAHTATQQDIPFLVRKKLFLIRPRILSAEFRYLPCWRVTLSYSVSYFKKARSDDGTVVFIVDPVKGCGVIEDRVDLKLEKKNIANDLLGGEMLTKEQAEKKAIVDARWKVLMARYKRPPELETKSIEKFYRPYYKAEYTYGSKVMSQWVAADDYGNYFVYN